MELAVFVDPPERRAEVVRSLDEEAAGVRRQPREPCARIQLQHVLDPLQRHRQRLLGAVDAGGVLDQPLLGKDLHLLADIVGRAPGAQAVRIDGIGRHVGAVGRLDDGVEPRRERR